VVGVKGQVRLDDRWYLPFYADVGTGDSDLTWQLEGNRGLDQLSFSGPAAAVTWRF
jgi:hypothetical protein